MNDKIDPITIARQMACAHAFARGIADSFPRCVRCGVSESDWEGMKANFWGNPIGLAGAP